MSYAEHGVEGAWCAQVSEKQQDRCGREEREVWAKAGVSEL